MDNLKIVYMGTPDFAVEPLKRLLDAGYDVVGVVTMPDKPAGRGYKMQASAVKQFAESRGLYILQPEKLKDPVFLQQLADLKADLQIVVAFRMLPEVVWSMPPMGTFNLHASLLPQYRGAAPINWAIINGEKESGITTFFLKHEIDTGDMIMQRRVEISYNDNAGTLHDKLMDAGADAVVETVRRIADGEVHLRPQPTGEDLKPAPKIFKADCEINFDDTVENVRNFIRGLSPYPAAYTTVRDAKGEAHSIKIFEVSAEKCGCVPAPGTVVSDGKNYIKFAARDGFAVADKVQLAGKKAMSAIEFLRGFKPFCQTD